MEWRSQIHPLLARLRKSRTANWPVRAIWYPSRCAEQIGPVLPGASASQFQPSTQLLCAQLLPDRGFPPELLRPRYLVHLPDPQHPRSRALDTWGGLPRWRPHAAKPPIHADGFRGAHAAAGAIDRLLLAK